MNATTRSSVAAHRRPASRRGFGVGAALLLLAAVAGCGQKGPLNLPSASPAASAASGAAR